MKKMKILYSGALALALGAFAYQAFADDKVDIEDFIDEASAKGVAEIETAKLALQKSSSQDVRNFAQRMIDEHTAANRELAQIARQKNLEVADEAELMAKAKKWILQLRDGESFDVAYANNQVVAHENNIELFKDAREVKNQELKAFINKTLPKLQNHLQMARQLVNTTQAAERNDTNRNKNDIRSTGTTGNNMSRSNMSGNNSSSNASARFDQDTDRGVGTVPPTTYSD